MKSSIFYNENNGMDNVILNVCKNSRKGIEGHNYSRWYDFYFSKIRYDKLNILEIGVKDGSSLEIWRKYFENSVIYGIDIDASNIKKRALKKNKIRVGDQTDLFFLNEICEEAKNGFDIIIDDGSHVSYDQIKTFKFLFPKLNKGGIYVIEDLQTSFKKKYNKGNKSCIQYMKEKIDEINFYGKFKSSNFKDIKLKKEKFTVHQKMIEGISFHTGICFVFKRTKLNEEKFRGK